jgi:type 1 glutamine amidotransferase
MMKSPSRLVLWSLIGGVLAALPILAQTPTGRGANAVPSVSVRRTDPRAGRTLMTAILGWRLGVRADAVGASTFWEAAAAADAGGVAFVEGISTQNVSPDIARPLDHNLGAVEIERARTRLSELRLRMAAYRLAALPADRETRRKAFEFGKTLGADTIIVPAESSEFVDLDRLAAELDLHVAVVSRDFRSAARGMAGRSSRIGLEVDLGMWRQAGERPAAALASLEGRVLALKLDDHSALGKNGRHVSLGTGVANLEALLLELSRQHRPARPADYPLPPGQDGNSSKQQVLPLLLTLDAGNTSDVVMEMARSAAAFDTAVRPAIAHYVDELARLTVISTPTDVPPDQRQRIAAAIPRQAPARARKPRKLLVLDLAYNGSFYHGSTRLGNLSLQLMSDQTKAFIPIFSNDLDNLKYPAIKQFDGVFLNQIQGDVFADDRAIEGLTRYVREGGGVAGLHAATWASAAVKEFGEMMGATSGAHKYNGEMGAVRVDDPGSPLTRQFEGKSFEFLDEFYHYVPTGPFSRDALHVLLSLDPSRKDLPGNQYTTRPDNDYGLVWIRSYGKGRVYNCGLGHRPEFYESPLMQQMMLAGIQFILGDLDADTTPGRSGN